jgi:hypothetical protein
MLGAIVLLLVSGGIVFGLKKLLVDHPEKLERFICQLYKTPYPPPSGVSIAKYQIGKMKILLWALLVLFSITIGMLMLGFIASILLHVFYH